MTTDASAVRSQLLGLFQAGADTPLPDDRFNALALEVFDHNFAAVPAYRAYCRARARTPDTVTHWTGIPPVPTAAFKELTLVAEGQRAERVFRTSGTTRGRQRRGAHHVPDLDLYRGALRPTFEAFLLPDGTRPRMVSLMPPAHAVPDSSLAFMISDVLEAFGGDEAVTVAHAEGIDFDALDRAMTRAIGDNRAVLLLGTSAAFIHWLDRLRESGTTFVLPEGSRLMDTGGFKGRGREVAPHQLRSAYGERLGLPPWSCVNEYGMTELLSQYYDTGLRDHLAGARSTGRKQGPGWLRTVAVDPETLDPLPAGETGLLRHVDLANLFSVAAVQTEDLGRVGPDGLVLEGRATGAPPRGCSIATDLLLSEAP